MLTISILNKTKTNPMLLICINQYHVLKVDPPTINQSSTVQLNNNHKIQFKLRAQFPQVHNLFPLKLRYVGIFILCLTERIA